MKRRIFSIILTALLIANMGGCGKGTGEGTTEEGLNQLTETVLQIPDSPITDFYYEARDNDGITITKYMGSDEQVAIPSTIDNVPVTAINAGAFGGAENLTCVVIPESVDIVDAMAFYNCTNLTRFVVKEGNPSYSSYDGVLYNKDQSQVILFPMGKQGTYTVPICVKSIGEYAFYRCVNLEGITISSGLESIGARAFMDCPRLTDIHVNEKNKFYSSIDGVLYNQDQTKLISVPGGKIGVFEIPDSVTEIGADAFYGCRGITNIKIPDSVTSLGEWAFSKCSALETVSIPDGIQEIPLALFHGCTGLADIVIPESVTKIDDMAFYNCEKLSNIELPSQLQSIGSRVFFGCTGISEMIIPEGVETMGAVVFQECTHVDIYVKQESRPVGWDSSWNHLNFPVVWGYTGS